jgi:hypothetical protein
MIIEGRELRDQLNDWPLGTKFKCVGHWDRIRYYYEGLIYAIEEDLEHGGRVLVCQENARRHENYLFKLRLNHYCNKRGNGYSGTWQLISSIEGKELEDYL